MNKAVKSAQAAISVLRRFSTERRWFFHRFSFFETDILEAIVCAYELLSEPNEVNVNKYVQVVNEIREDFQISSRYTGINPIEDLEEIDVVLDV